ncbi:MAG: FAD-dependent thymidylate synthase [Rickettsiales bacterium]|nr:FAD-dependent thymidylate synthase [Rickettsiales bacterium]
MHISKQHQKEIEQLQAQSYQTKRKTVSELEDVLYEPFNVLDHGFVRVVDYMGDDSAVVQAARVSYGTGTKKVNQDKGLINYLMRHRHTTPFEMCEIKFHIKLPIFIARQWIRHRTANVNEYSARYSVLDKEFYIPTAEQLAPQSQKNHQGRGNDQLTEQEAQEVLRILKDDSERCYNNYQTLMNQDETGEEIDPNRQGIARELARMNLNLNYYTQWYWKIDLHNLLHFLSLRADSHAQYEIRAYADVILDLVKKWVPHTYEAFMNYRVNGAFLSGMGLEVVKRLINGQKPNYEDMGMSKREWDELMQLLDRESLDQVA